MPGERIRERSPSTRRCKVLPLRIAHGNPSIYIHRCTFLARGHGGHAERRLTAARPVKQPLFGYGCFSLPARSDLLAIEAGCSGVLAFVALEPAAV